MKWYAVIGSGGTCEDEYGKEVRNDQILGIVRAKDEDAALDGILESNGSILMDGLSFLGVHAVELVSRTPKCLPDIIGGGVIRNGECHIRANMELGNCLQNGEKSIRVYLDSLKRMLSLFADRWEKYEQPMVNIDIGGLNPAELTEFLLGFAGIVSGSQFPKSKIRIVGVGDTCVLFPVANTPRDGS